MHDIMHKNIEHTQNGVLFSYQEEWNPAIVTTSMEAGVMLSTVNLAQKDKYHLTL